MDENDKVEQLARRAEDSTAEGKFSDAHRLLKEAISIAPEHIAVKKAWQSLQEQEGSKAPLIALCRKYLDTQKEEDGDAILKLIEGADLSRDIAEQAIKELDDFHGEDDKADEVTAALLRHEGARRYLANQLISTPHLTFRAAFDRGDDTTDGMLLTLLEKQNKYVWLFEDKRVAAQRDVFQLALAKLMEAGLDHPERAMRAVARLLAAEARNLNGLIDADSFAVILENLDIRSPNVVRSQATLATAKLLELSPDVSEKIMRKFVAHRVAKPTTDSLVRSFSAAAAIFPIAQQSAAALFLTPGFIDTFVDLVQPRRSQTLDRAALELLSAACVDKPCREAILTHCADWLRTIINTASSDISRAKSTDKRSSLAALILIKLKQAAPSKEQEKIIEEDGEEESLIVGLKNVVIGTSAQGGKLESVEGLAYSSLQPKVKEDLAGDETFISKLIESMRGPKAEPQLVYGGLSIMANLTAYNPVLSEEAKKIAQLKAYANSSKPRDADPLDDDSQVTVRCKKLLGAGVIPLLTSIKSRATPTMRVITVSILLSLAKEAKHRGLMAQQGAVKLILQLWEQAQNEGPPQKEADLYNRNAAHTLARILISVNPAHIFTASSALPVTSAIRPLTYLVAEDQERQASSDESTRDLLPVFESLLALTNLASYEASARETIIRFAWPKLEDLLLGNNRLITRATVELVCNLMASPEGVALFADGSKQAGNRMHILLALSDVDDLPTRRAAGGALAMLTEWDTAVEALLQKERGVTNLLELCEDESEELQHRGVVCVKNVVTAPGEIGKRGVKKVKEERGWEVISTMAKNCKQREVLATAVEVLKILQ